MFKNHQAFLMVEIHIYIILTIYIVPSCCEFPSYYIFPDIPETFFFDILIILRQMKNLNKFNLVTPKVPNPKPHSPLYAPRFNKILFIVQILSNDAANLVGIADGKEMMLALSWWLKLNSYYFWWLKLKYLKYALMSEYCVCIFILFMLFALTVNSVYNMIILCVYLIMCYMTLMH